MVVTTVTRAAPHYLIADGAPLAVRRTRGGDAWLARAAGAAAARAGLTGGTGLTGTGMTDGAGRPGQPVLLGMPAARPA